MKGIILKSIIDTAYDFCLPHEQTLVKNLWKFPVAYSTSHFLLKKCKNQVLLIYLQATSLNSLWLFNKTQWGIFKSLWQGCQRIYEWKNVLRMAVTLDWWFCWPDFCCTGAERRMTVTSNINTRELPSLTANKSCCRNLTQHCPWPREHYKIWFITERRNPARFKLFSHVSYSSRLCLLYMWVEYCRQDY